jgi:hypothetical protein
MLINPVLYARIAECPLRSKSDLIAATPENDAKGQQATLLYYFFLAIFFASARAQSMKSCATGLSARFCRVTITFWTCAIGS